MSGSPFCSGAVHPRCALNSAEGAFDADESKFGVQVTGEAGLPRQGVVHLVDFLPRLHTRIDGAANGGGSQQLRTARLWEDAPPEASGEGNERDGGWQLRGRPIIGAGDEPCSYCGRALDVWGT